jgi:hypothetical protein
MEEVTVTRDWCEVHGRRFKVESGKFKARQILQKYDGTVQSHDDGSCTEGLTTRS